MNNGISIRNCNISDIEMLVKMRLDFLKEAGHVKEDTNVQMLSQELTEYMKAHINIDIFFWVAESEKVVVSTGALNLWDKLPSYTGEQTGSKCGYVSNIYTVPGYRRQGIASNIVKEITKFGKSIGIFKLMLHALEAGKGVYKDLDFLQMRVIWR